MIEKFLLRHKQSRKVFGKKEIEIISKQLNGIKLTQSEKNRLSRDIRPKFNFIKECSQFTDEFKLTKNQNNQKIVKDTIEAIINDRLSSDIDKVLLFGSFADKTYNQRSDIDICVIFKKEISIKEATAFRIRLSSEIDDKVDIQIYNLLEDKIKKSVDSNHKILFDSSRPLDYAYKARKEWIMKE
ncbi:MAG: nucleotidyltransferase domain-containing protein [Nanoarchaeota archaeon]|nr:nucleotidyltransferase domain-containing protein [Nanoarchaeota archaeon]MBU1703768.1 nucleotidyltransferase domain-containing protein [Nanoarchaeota archaeon]